MVEHLGKAHRTALRQHMPGWRQQRQFIDWNDFIVRIKGIGRKKAAALSREGLTINGEAYADAPAAAQRKDAAED